ncbi:WXG100 family type VII secretion target [Nocardia blacklockiae]|uniref:WXG100 family type VII secretion target n=1 Tax=Nocardia blacklockiae TaxID=480036 RepID=UPI001894B0F3|nr:WXG100 family type VII secretion target [Nocardia blacklockiae]MBF6171422.1 hypothetical protein [Nocardia blacklockiae]
MASSDSEWATLKTAATNGYLQFDPKDAVTGAQAAADLVGELLALAKMVRDNKLDHLDPFGSLFSGRELSGAFNTKGARLHSILENHAKIVADMGDTFVAAGKKYASTDTGSGAEFAELDDLKMPKDPAKLNGGPSHSDLRTPDLKGFDFKNPDFPSSLKDYKGDKDSGVTITYENKDSLSYDDLYQLGQSIKAQPVEDASGVWKWMAGELYTKLTDFVNTITSLGNSWKGNGASAAVAASRNYQKGVQPLADAMVAMSQNLDYTAQWLYATQLSMPTDPNADSCCPGSELDYYRGEFESHYIEGIKNSVSIMPALNGPFEQPQNQGGNNQNGNNQGGNQGGNNQGGNQGGNNQGGNNQGGTPYQQGYNQGYQQGYQQGANGGPYSQNLNGQQNGDPYAQNSGYGQNNGDPYGQNSNGGNGQNNGDPYGQNQNGGYGQNSADPYGQNTNGGYGQNGGNSYGQAGGGQNGGDPYAQNGGEPYGQNGNGQDANNPYGQNGNTGGQSGSATGGQSGGASGGQSDGQSGTYQQGYQAGYQKGYQQGQQSAGATGGRSSSQIPSPTGQSGGSSVGKSATPSIPSAAIPQSSVSQPNVPSSQGSSGQPGGIQSSPKSSSVPTSSSTPSSAGYTPKQVSPSAAMPSTPTSADDVASRLRSQLTGSTASSPDTPFSAERTSGIEKSVAQPDSSTYSSTTDPADTTSPTSSVQAGSGVSSVLGQLADSLSQGIQAFTQLGGTLNALDPLHALASQLPDPAHLPSLEDLANLDPASHAGGGGGHGGGAGGGASIPTPEHPLQETKSAQLFPRAALPDPPDHAGASGGASQPGMGGPMGGPAGGAGGTAQGGKDHKPAKYLTGRLALDEALEDMPHKVKPVIEP